MLFKVGEKLISVELLKNGAETHYVFDYFVYSAMPVNDDGHYDISKEQYKKMLAFFRYHIKKYNQGKSTLLGYKNNDKTFELLIEKY